MTAEINERLRTRRCSHDHLTLSQRESPSPLLASQDMITFFKNRDQLILANLSPFHRKWLLFFIQRPPTSPILSSPEMIPILVTGTPRIFCNGTPVTVLLKNWDPSHPYSTGCNRDLRSVCFWTRFDSDLTQPRFHGNDWNINGKIVDWKRDQRYNPPSFCVIRIRLRRVFWSVAEELCRVGLASVEKPEQCWVRLFAMVTCLWSFQAARHVRRPQLLMHLYIRCTMDALNSPARSMYFKSLSNFFFICVQSFDCAKSKVQSGQRIWSYPVGRRPTPRASGWLELL